MKLLRAIIGTIFSNSLGPVFSLPVNSLTSCIARFLQEVWEFAPHDFGAFLLA